MTKRIAVDWDGTLAATHDLVAEIMNFKHGTHYTRADWNSWTFWQDHVPNGDADFWAVFDILDRTHLRRAIRPESPLACGSIKWLQQHGFEVELLTSNNGVAAKDIAGWLFGHGLDIPVRTLQRGSAHQKLELDYDIFIDDAPALAEEFMKGSGNKWLILYDQPWNRHIDTREPQKIVRLDDWRDAIDLVQDVDLEQNGE